MAAEAVQAGVGQGGVPVRSELNVLLLYEDMGTALRAKQALDLLSDRLGATAGFCARLWRLDLLGEPLLAEQAAIEAAAADVIVLSVHGRNGLRAEARGWLTRWLAHKAVRPYALAALLDPEPAQPGSVPPVLAYLKRIAEVAHADLFYGSCAAPVPTLNSAGGKSRAREPSPSPAETSNRTKLRP
jgi:hypothetical protein